MRFDQPLTPIQVNVNNAIDLLGKEQNMPKVTRLCTEQFNCLSKLLQTLKGEKPRPVKLEQDELNSYYSRCHKHQLSTSKCATV